MEEGFKVTYRGIEIPEWMYDVSMGEDYQNWAGGVDEGIRHAEDSQDESELPPMAGTAYRYFHDGDDPGYRWWRRAPIGGQNSTEERYQELQGRWVGQGAVSLGYLVNGDYVEVPANEVPKEIR